MSNPNSKCIHRFICYLDVICVRWVHISSKSLITTKQRFFLYKSNKHNSVWTESDIPSRFILDLFRFLQCQLFNKAAWFSNVFMIPAFRKLKAQPSKLHWKLQLIFIIANVIIMAVINLSDRFVLQFENRNNERSNLNLYFSLSYSIVNL